jgi:hypothetical protein
VSGVKVFSGPRAYAKYVDIRHKTGIAVLDRLTRRNGQPNFNHQSFIEISKLRMRGSRYYLEQRPWQYADTVMHAWVAYFKPTTRWHPRDARSSPHRENRAVLGGWEDLYNDVFHRFPIPPVGLYLPWAVVFGYGVARALRHALRRRFDACPREQLVLWMAFNCVYVPGLSCLCAISELARYRFIVEASMWTVFLWALQRQPSRALDEQSRIATAPLWTEGAATAPTSPAGDARR